MRPEKVSGWRERLPPPFDKPSPPLKRRASALYQSQRPPRTLDDVILPDGNWLSGRRRRRGSAPGALDQTDRKINWLRFVQAQRTTVRREKSAAAVEKLRRIKQAKSQRRQSTTVASTLDLNEKFKFKSTYPVQNAANEATVRKHSVWSSSAATLKEPTRSELLALASECFPPIEESRVIITEYSHEALRTSEFTLEEVLVSDCILQPGDLIPRVRWIYVEYHKMGTFWGSDYRFSQWGTDPALFEKSPILLLQQRLADLDRKAGRLPLESEDLPGHKRIGKYYREAPGCPEYLGLRVNSEAWLKSEPYELLLDYLKSNPRLSHESQRLPGNDLDYGLAYINAVDCIRKSAYEARPGLREIHRIAELEQVYAYGSWDDNVERLEFYREHTLLSSGSPSFYKVVADRLRRRQDPLRQQVDCALLYYTLARVSIENDEMMHDAPERALNQVFARLKNNRNTDRDHVELIFNMQQTVLDGLEYLEENRRELPIWGIPPFGNHRIKFHPDHDPPEIIRELIQHEMDFVDKDFAKVIENWKSLERKVDRYLDVLLQFRVLEQQELAISQRHLATQQQDLAIEEAKSSRIQSNSVMIFTAITIVFVPLSFFTSYFGMNLTDIVETPLNTMDFWKIAGPVSGGIVVLIFTVAKCLSIVKEPPLDLEKAEDPEYETLWRSRLTQARGKIKNS